MIVARIGFAACFAFFLFFPPDLTHSTTQAGAIDSVYAGAFGTIVDSITVTGNKSTRSIVVLREMETRPGSVLDRHILERDINFVRDLSPIAQVVMTADSLSPGHSALRIRVTERRGVFVNSILPVVKYDFETGINYGVRWNAKNFRGRLEQLTLTLQKNQRGDDFLSFSWSAPWVGWHHVSLGASVSYYNRGDITLDVTALERIGFSAFLGIPLTESRIRFSQLRGALTFSKTRNGGRFDPITREVAISPSVGYFFDSRNSHVRPGAGGTFAVVLGATYPQNSERKTYYRVSNEIRLFHRLSRKFVLGGLSNFFYQFGDFPDYAEVRLGGPENLRGVPQGRYRGFHRWFQTLELRYEYLPSMVFTVPFIREVDVGLTFITFLDGGIVWHSADQFDFNYFHGTGGVGIRFYSPIRDVTRFDFGFNLLGSAMFHLRTGIRF